MGAVRAGRRGQRAAAAGPRGRRELADAAGARGRGCRGVCLGIKGADCGLLFHCYGFKGQWGIVVSGDPIVCFRCRSQPRGAWRFPEGQAGSVCGTLNNGTGMFPSPPPPHSPS